MTTVAIDEMSVLLAGISLVVFLYYQWNVFQPDIHGSFLNTQANTSPTRLPGETCVYRHRSVPFSSELSHRISREVSSIQHILTKTLEHDTKILGYLSNDNSKAVSWLTGLELKNRVLSFGNSLISYFGGDSSIKSENLYVAVVAEQTYFELVIAMIAGVLFNFPLEIFSPDMISTSEGLGLIFKNVFSEDSKPVILCSFKKIPLVIEAIKDKSYASTALVIVLNSPDGKLANYNSSGVQVKLFKDFGSGTGGQLTPPSKPANSEDLLYRIWTCGSDNVYRSATFQDKHVMASVAATSSTFPVQLRLGKNDVYASSRSVLATSEWSTILFMFNNEIPVGLGDCLAQFQPTVVFLPSRELLELSHRWGLNSNSVKKLGSIEHWLLHSELSVLKRHRCLQNSNLISTCFKKERLELGSRVRLIYTSNPYIPLDILNSLRVALGVQIITTLPLSPYRQNARCASFGWALVGTFFDYIFDHKLPLVGGPAPSVEAKLINIPEQNADDSQRDPIGPVLIRGTSSVKVVEKNKNDLSVTDVWLESGWLGRVNNTCSIALLGTGDEPISLRFLETWISAHCSFVHMINLLSSDSKLTNMNGQIFLRSEPLLKFAQEHKLALDLEQLLKSTEVKDHILRKIRSELVTAIEYLAAAQRSTALDFPKIDLNSEGISFNLAPKPFQFDENIVKDPEFWE